MTETSYPITAITGHEYTPVPPALSGPVAVGQRHGGPASSEGAQEDDGQISCLCGYVDDDGWTVACDLCNRWQHQICYYPQFEDRALPEDLQHYCVECQPRPFDVDGARARQDVKREEQANLANGIKRPASKSHKKKVKEPGFANGWPLDKARHDRNSASPRDHQPPPPKRPKTSHRHSDSTNTTLAKAVPRKRNPSVALLRRSSRSGSPESPIDFYSEDFMRCYLDDRWAVTHANLHNSIAVTNALSEWLTLSDDTFREMHGHEKTEVLMRWDGELDDIPGKAEIEIQDEHDNRVRDDDDNFPTWKVVTVKEPVASGAYIGELKGHVGFKEDYQQDASNRWALLRHPEPFIFFHPRLPIYIDARNEGTELRYVRRSCSPNARLQVLVTDQTDYRFCFMATRQIEPGMEVAVGWDTSYGLPEFMRRHQNSVSARDMDKLSAWVSIVLANCGPCACQLPISDCRMSRFDRRITLQDYEDMKLSKSKRKKVPAPPHVSPLNTHVNSRSGSEVHKIDPDDEPTDSRSTSGSAGRGSDSRDMTPNTHYSHNGSLSTMPELSERERKKLAKEEEMFRRQEEEQSGKQSKKKRGSGGSTLNTPSATSSKQLGHGGPPRYADAGTSRYTDGGASRSSGPSSTKTSSRKRSKGSAPPKMPPKTITKIVKRPPPDYVDSGVQCDLDQEEAQKHTPLPERRRPFLSTSQRLLQRCVLNNAKRRRPACNPPQPARDGDEMDVDQHPEPTLFSRSRLISSATGASEAFEFGPHPVVLKDVEMQDVPCHEQTAALEALTSGAEESAPTDKPATSTTPTVSSSPPLDPPAPPWPSVASHSARETISPSHPHHPTHLHVQMPPPTANPFAAAAAATALSASVVSPTTAGASVMQSPVSLIPFGPGTPMFSPSVSAAVTPSPAKKKLSLSDYTRRSKAKDPATAGAIKSERDSSPASTASGPVATVTTPNAAPAASDVAPEAADTATAVLDDDLKMEDQPTPTTTTTAASAAVRV